jgi:hypothetical protein
MRNLLFKNFRLPAPGTKKIPKPKSQKPKKTRVIEIWDLFGTWDLRPACRQAGFRFIYLELVI